MGSSGGRKVWSVSFTPGLSLRKVEQQPGVSAHAEMGGVLPRGSSRRSQDGTDPGQPGRARMLAEGTLNPFDGDPSLAEWWGLWQHDPM